MSERLPRPGRARPDDRILQGIELLLLLLDVDGVLTDGRIHFDFEGREYKSFHVHDAAGIVYSSSQILRTTARIRASGESNCIAAAITSRYSMSA